MNTKKQGISITLSEEDVSFINIVKNKVPTATVSSVISGLIKKERDKNKLGHTESIGQGDLLIPVDLYAKFKDLMPKTVIKGIKEGKVRGVKYGFDQFVVIESGHPVHFIGRIMQLSAAYQELSNEHSELVESTKIIKKEINELKKNS